MPNKAMMSLLIGMMGLVMVWGFAPSPDQVSAQGEVVPVVTANDDWTPVYETIGGIEMALVPPGCFMMGEDGESGEQCFDAPFWIGKYEVTNAEYARFMEAGGYQNAAYWTELGWSWRQRVNSTQPSTWASRNFNEPQQPVAGVSWYEAYAYTQWLSAETGLDFCLPTEAEWEYAARGPDGLIYPWGNEFNVDNIVYGTNVISRTARVATYPQGASWVGAFHMTGNVWEWVLSEYRDYPYVADDGRNEVEDNRNRVLRSISWNDHAGMAQATSIFQFSPDTYLLPYGFRLCAAYVSSSRP